MRTSRPPVDVGPADRLGRAPPQLRRAAPVGGHGSGARSCDGRGPHGLQCQHPAPCVNAAGYGCHSNEADWPLYSYVAPLSWLVQSDVERGRDELNFSDWPEDADEADDAIDAILDGSMPPDRYTRIHRGARLSDSEADELIRALREIGEDGEGDDDRG